MSIPYFSLGGSGLPLFFLHANGYPSECYSPLITCFSAHYNVSAIKQRPLWPDSRPEEIADWHPLTDDFLHFLDERQTGPVIAVGHSLGGIVALRAALRRPDRFRALVLIDPVLFPPRMIIFIRLTRALGLLNRLHPLAEGALHRRRVFEDLTGLSESYRRKSVFRFFNSAGMDAYVEGITRPRPDGKYELVYSPEWEARIYVTGIWHDMDLWRGLPRLKIPLLVIRGAETDTFWASTGCLVKQKTPAARVVTIPESTHLVPLERPDAVCNEIQDFLQEIL